MDNQSEEEYWEFIDHSMRMLELQMVSIKEHVKHRTNNPFRDEIGVCASSILTNLKQITKVSKIVHEQRVLKLIQHVPGPILHVVSAEKLPKGAWVKAAPDVPSFVDLRNEMASIMNEGELGSSSSCAVTAAAEFLANQPPTANQEDARACTIVRKDKT